MKKHQQRLTEFLFLLTGLVCIFASSCSYTGLPFGTKITSGSPQVVMPAELSGWPSSTPAISMALTVTFDDACSAGQTFNILSLNIKPSGSDENILDFSVDCDTLMISVTGTYLSASMTTSAAMFDSSNLGAVSIAFAMSFDKNLYSTEIQTLTTQAFDTNSFTFTDPWSFDSLTKINICSGRGCTVNNFYLFDDYFTSDSPTAYTTMATPELYSFYTLLDGSLRSADGSSGSAYFGDSSSSPSSGTSPKWDSKKEYVEITKEGQFLSLPLPVSFKPSTALTASSLSVSAWVKIISIPSSEATILALHQADGTQLSVSFAIKKASKAATFYTGDQSTTGPTVSFNTWHLVGFTLSIKKGLKGVLGAIFVDSQVTPFSKSLSTSLDLSSAAVLRVGGSTSSFVGNIFGVRITTPGGGYIPESSNALELGLGSFPLLCAANYKLNSVDNTCRKECPIGNEESTSTPVALCLPLSSDLGSNLGSKNLLSAGVIVAIVLGGIAIILVVILAIRYAYKKNKFRVFIGSSAAKGKRKDEVKAYTEPVSLPISPTAIEGPLTAEAP